MTNSTPQYMRGCVGVEQKQTSRPQPLKRERQSLRKTQSYQLLSDVSITPIVLGHSSRATRKPVILVVDDELSVSKTLAWLLQENGYNSMFCLDAKTALDIASGIAADVAIW